MITIPTGLIVKALIESVRKDWARAVVEHPVSAERELNQATRC